MLSIYSYNNFKDLLRDQIQEKKNKNPSFSLRSFAKQLGLKSHGPIQQIMAGERILPKKYLPFISKSFNLNENERSYLEALIDFEKSKSLEEKTIYYEKLKKLRPKNQEIRIFELENYKFFENPLHSIILTLMERVDYQHDVRWIQSKLRFKVTQNEILQAINLLLDLGMATEEEGKAKIKQSNWSSKHDVPSKAVQSFHHKMGLLAAEEVEKQPVADREYQSMSLNLRKDRLPEAKKIIQKFIQEFMQEFDSPEDQTLTVETYHINTQLFALTKKDINETH
jgi:uncharacterized protein (TIGR02147 family)